MTETGRPDTGTETGRRGLCDFFRTDGVQQLIARLAEAREMTLVVGAGSSIEVGFPNWDTLVRRLLVQVARHHGLAGDDCDQFADWTIRGDSLTGAAAVVKAALRDGFVPALHTALYEQQLTPLPGATARAATSLLLTKPEDSGSRLTTTNYDLVLESALTAALGLKRGSATWMVHPDSIGDVRRSVLHLHGVITPRGRERGTVVLSEQDYHRMQQPETWQEQFFADRLSASTCLFVGMSLTDPNLLRYLYRADGTTMHVAVFVRQQSSSLYDSTPPAVAAARELTATSRWKAVGVEPVQADFYAQSAQLLHEIVHYTRTGAAGVAYRPFPDRLDEWRRRISETVFVPDRGEFERVQDALHAVMAALADGVRKDLSGDGHGIGNDERLGVALWIYDPRSESLTNWASSDRVWRDPSTLAPVPVGWKSDFVAVQAFCSGSLVSRSTTHQTLSRWNHVVGIPLYVESDVWGRLPVGSVTLASTEPAPRSVLAQRLSALRQVSLPSIEHALAELFLLDDGGR